MVTAPKIQEEVHQCRWLECTTIFESAEALYEHITTVHIGRKSAGTLSLECKWAGCSSKASKRDHLTSHARVHINLKPHTCSICNKAFKRPQDLKKHEKIHTEEHHTAHKNSKAVTVNGPSSGAQSHGGDEKQAPVQPVNFPGSYLPPNYAAAAFGYPVFPGQQGFDLATFLAQQQQLNAHVQAGYPLSQLGLQGMPSMPAYPMAYPGAQGGNAQAQAQAAQAAQAMQMQMLAANGMFFPAAPYGFHPGQQAMQMPQQQQHHHQQQPQPQQQQPLRPPPSAPAPVAAASSLYPSLPSMLYANNASSPVATHIKVEDIPSPAASIHSTHSHSSSARSAAGYSHHSSSVSPRVPALSPPSVSSPENTYSPPSEYETEVKPYISTAIAGKKRAFEETAEQFLGDIKSKRFQGEDAVAQLDAMSHFIFSPEMTAPPLTPARSQDNSSGSSIASDYSNADVDTINDLLLSLGQQIESNSYGGVDLTAAQPHHHQQQQQQQQQQHFNHSPLPAYTPSMYPSLPSMDRSFASPRMAPGQQQMYGQDYSARFGKSVAAPSISNDHKQPIYNHVNRLTRAAPVSSSRTGMEVDEEAQDAKGYSSSIRSTSLDSKPSPPAVLAPILPSRGVGAEGLRLPSIASITSPSAPASSGSGITLPSIRDMLERHSSTSPGPVSSPMSDSSSTASTSSSRTIYPSFPTSSSRSTSTSESSRPQSSGGVERLSHRVHKLDIRHNERSDSASSSVVGAGDLSESDDDENDDHPSISKKSRVESPEPMEEDRQRQPTAEQDRQREELKQRRLFVIQSLMVIVNAQYRKKLAAEASAKKAPSPAVASPAPVAV